MPRYGENSLDPPTVAFHYSFELRPPVRRHAEAIDDDVADLVHTVTCVQAPIDSDRTKRRAVSRPSAGFAADLAGDDGPIRIGPAIDYPWTTAAIGVFLQRLAIGEHGEILEQPQEFLLLCLGKNPPKSAENKAT